MTATQQLIALVAVAVLVAAYTAYGEILSPITAIADVLRAGR